MTQTTRQEQAQGRKERPAAPTSLTEQHSNRPRTEGTLIELTDAELQAVTGGGSKPGIGSGSNEH